MVQMNESDNTSILHFFKAIFKDYYPQYKHFNN